MGLQRVIDLMSDGSRKTAGDGQLLRLDKGGFDLLAFGHIGK